MTQQHAAGRSNDQANGPVAPIACDLPCLDSSVSLLADVQDGEGYLESRCHPAPPVPRAVATAFTAMPHFRWTNRGWRSMRVRIPIEGEL